MKAIFYNTLSHASKWIIWPTQFFSKKMKLFVNGRKNTFQELQQKLPKNRKETVWMHCASLGEFEQGVPVLNALKREAPDTTILITFFSPSGYEVKKNSPLADLVTYLPIDTKSNAKKFIRLVKPTKVIFVKYEIWPNYLMELQRQKIPTYLISGLFRAEQIYFRKWGSFMRKALFCFDHIFVQNKVSEELLKSIGFQNITVSGDTRFDRVSQQIERDNTLDFMETFTKDAPLCLVCGSTWPEDDAIIWPFIMSAVSETLKVVVAPHSIHQTKIEKLITQSSGAAVKLSEATEASLSQSKILIVDSVGLLPKIYSYATIAYVGGGMGNSGLHNILEPATFGTPIIIGKNYQKFPEAVKLREIAGLYSVQNPDEFMDLMKKFVEDAKFRSQTGMIAGHFIQKNTGATQKILQIIR